MREENRGITTLSALTKLIDTVGFLPLFDTVIPGFSVMSATKYAGWWTGEDERDPWQWRALIAQKGEIAYGKFFSKKAGFVSKKWFPDFVNFRRDGYDFDARYEDGLARYAEKQIYDCFDNTRQIPSFRLKQMAGVEKGFEGALTLLMMRGYLTTCGMVQKQNKKGMDYGWPCSLYTRAESLFGEAYVKSAYEKKPEASLKAILEHLSGILKGTEENTLLAFIK